MNTYFFFFNDTATTEIYTLSLHDALPISRIVKLERNYRFTQNILDAAGAVVANYPQRLGKSLKAEKSSGTILKYFEARDPQAEAEYVAGELGRILSEDSDQTCAVEYRTNSQSRAFEEVFRRQGVRYKLVGGFSFYHRAEIGRATSELQSQSNLVCRLLLEKKKKLRVSTFSAIS